MNSQYTIEEIFTLVSGMYSKYSLHSDNDFLDYENVNILEQVLKEVSLQSGKDTPKKYKFANRQCTVQKFKLIHSYINKTINYINKTKTEPLYLNANNSTLYYSFRNKIATQDFSTPGNDWPSAQLGLNSDSVQALAIVKPASQEDHKDIYLLSNNMSEYVKNMSDLTADVYDILNNEWLNKATSEDSMITITAADILRYRGIQPRGKNNTFHKSALENISKQIDILDKTWVKVFQVSVAKENTSEPPDIFIGETKAVVLTSRVHQLNPDKTMQPYSWRIRPGDCFTKYLFGPGRKRAMLSQKAVAYDYYRQKYEKRLTRFLSWEWGISSKAVTIGDFQIFKIKTLLDAISFSIEKEKPSKSKDKFEKILNTLEQDKIICKWEYGTSNTEFSYGEKFWLEKWLEWEVCIQAPPEIIQLEQNNFQYESYADDLEFTTNSLQLGQLLKDTRIKRNCSQLSLSKILNISRGTISKIETGKLSISPAFKKSIWNWIKNGDVVEN